MQSELRAASELVARLGLLPRIFAAVQVLVFVPALVVASLVTTTPWPLLGIVIPAAAFGLALRVKVQVFTDRLVVRSYLRTREFMFDQIETFIPTDYLGIWSGGGSAGWMGLHQIDGEKLNYASSFSLPETLCSHRLCEQVTDALNRIVDCRQSRASDVER